MSQIRRSPLALVAGACALLSSIGASAATVEYIATQGPKADLNSATPPALTTQVADAVSGFGSNVQAQGTASFEAGGTTIQYGNGSAVLTGGDASIVDGASVALSRGRYNMTPDLPPLNSGRPDFGHWLEATSSFSYVFSTDALNAFSFFATDLGDFGGTLTIEFMRDGEIIYSKVLANTDTSPVTQPTATGPTPLADGAGNGNLLFFGITLDGGYDQVNFNIAQAVGSTVVDVLGFDQIVVGTADTAPTPTPEPGTLALAGLALAGMGASLRRRAVR